MYAAYPTFFYHEKVNFYIFLISELAEESIDGRFGKGLIEYSLDLLLAVAGEAQKVEANTFDSTSVIAGQSDDLGLGGY